MATIEKIVPQYDERDNYNPKGRDVDPRFAAGWNAAVDAMNSGLANGCEHQIVRPATSHPGTYLRVCIDCNVVGSKSDFANFHEPQDAEKSAYERGKKDGKASVYRSHTSEDAR